MKCKNCYAQIKKDSTICDYCGTPIVIEKTLNKKEKNNNDEVLPRYEEDRLSPEFRQILGSGSYQNTSTELEQINHQSKQNFEPASFEKRVSRKWGIAQTIIEFFFFCGLLGIVEGNLEQENIVIGIYFIWSSIRAFNFFVLKRGKK